MVVLAGGTAATVHGALARAAAAEGRWQTTRTVAVARHSIELGEPISGAIELRRLPVAAVPADALRDIPTGRLAMARIGKGEVLTAPRVSGQDAGGVAAILPPGTRALVIPLQVPGLPVQPGDRVDLLASGTGGLPVADGGTPPSRPIARSALVVSAGAKALVVAVGKDDATAVAAALGQGPLIPALTGPGG